jgi:hypothetical protein
MRKITALVAILLTAFVFMSCDDDTTDPIIDEEGNIFVTSVPAGAEIWLNNTNTGKVTPDTLTGVVVGTHQITLSLNDYRDTTVAVNVNANQTTTATVTLTPSIALTPFGPRRIYETAGTTAAQPSGLDLSSGNAYGISSTNNVDVDIYYSTDGTGGTGYLVQSADLSSTAGMTRVTKFRVGLGTNLNDGADSFEHTVGSWTNNMSDRETNYVFLYDNDGHYSKLKIVDFGGGTPGNPAWVEVQWWYNATAADVRF